MATSFVLTLVTLAGTTTHSDVVRITLETPLGQTTLLPHHEPLLSILNPGMMEIEHEGSQITSLVVSGGFIEVTKEANVEIMLDAVENPEAVDVASAEKARQRAKEMLEQKHDLSEVDYARFESMLDHEIARIRIATKGGRV